MAAPPLQVISGDATPDEVAAITAALAAVFAEREAAARAASAGDGLDAWVRASRLTARRAGLMRGPWRLSGRIGRRARA
ncbi:MAG TPA: acyl-CoA carboxylase epsilon subunit [Acidimicrobiia bacterium]|nr:acyl-CoA carboxylase epsilon subunit [Acidimicrobiia bacterium]